MGLKQQIFPDNLLFLELVFCMLLALVLGFAIGFERKMRFKEAGIRTHTIVCMGACIYMMVSMYAFGDDADISRVAAQIVPGIGFIGAGMIFYRKKMIQGLTTAAGIWATAAVGMACGAGWYYLSAIATFLIIGIQCLMHLNTNFFHSKHFVQIKVVYQEDENGGVSKTIRNYFDVKKFTEVTVKKEGENLIYTAVLSSGKEVSAEEIMSFLSANKTVLSMSRQDDDF